MPRPVAVRAPTLMAVLTVAALLVSVAAGCGFPSTARTPDSPSSPTDGLLPTRSVPGLDEDEPTGDTVGVLVVDHGGGCISLADPSTTGELLSLRWPHGYRLAQEPHRVVDAEGHTVAVEGDLVRLGGARWDPAAEPQPCDGGDGGWDVWHVEVVDDPEAPPRRPKGPDRP